MSDRYIQSAIYTYIENLMNHTSHQSLLARKVLDWVTTYGEDLDIYFNVEEDESKNPYFPVIAHRFHRVRKAAKPVWDELQQFIHREKKTLGRGKPTLAIQNLRSLARTMGIPKSGIQILEFVAMYQISTPFEELCDQLFERNCLDTRLVGKMLNLRHETILRQLSAGSRLLDSGIINTSDISRSRINMEISEKVLQAISPPNNGLDDIRNAILGTPCEPKLLWDDFEHISTERDFTLELLSGAIKNRVCGINVLIYGSTGTGKTELCKSLAEKLGTKLYAVGEKDQYDAEPSRRDRLSEARIAQSIAQYTKNSLLLFDELEDLLTNYSGSQRLRWPFHYNSSSGSKVYMNRFLENNTVPTLWTANTIDDFDPALLRRFSFAFEIRTPPRNIRKRVWERVASSNNLQLTENQLVHFADMNAPPALSENAALAIRLTGRDSSDIPMIVNNLTTAINGGVPRLPDKYHDIPFDQSISCTDINLDHLTHQLTDQGIKPYSLCLYGPPGTGKSAYIRYLAKLIGMEILFKRASDLLGMYVGQSEKNIARAFSEARANHTFLIIDEADSLLRDRAGAFRSWEVTQVNEMLTWMEAHDLPFACTTNLMESLDRAAMRRFTFKIKFTYLGPAEIKVAFKHFFGKSAIKQTVALDRLTPGDFAVVKKKAEILGVSDTDTLTHMLHDECLAKPQVTRSIGFH